MTTPAANIQQAIDVCSDNIGQISYDGVISLKVRMAAWITAIFGTAGVFPSSESAPQRRVTDWFGYANQAYDSIESATPGQTGVESTSNVIQAVTRTLYAVRDAAAAGAITVAQRNATVTAFNTNWT